MISFQISNDSDNIIMSFEYLARETGYLEKPALHPSQSTNDQEVHRMQRGWINGLIYGEDSVLGNHSTKVLGALAGSVYAIYTGRSPVWPYGLIGALVGWILQMKAVENFF